MFSLSVAHYHAGAVNDRFIGRLVAKFLIRLKSVLLCDFLFDDEAKGYCRFLFVEPRQVAAYGGQSSDKRNE